MQDNKIFNVGIIPEKVRGILLTVVVLLFAILAFTIQIFGQVTVERPSPKYTIVLDAGHGGHDPGKVGVDGTLEKDLNLKIVLKLKAELEARGHTVLLTRADDDSLATPGATNKKISDMNNRVEFINRCEADYLISIHQNSYTDESVHGAQVFYLESSKEGKELASNIQKNIKYNVDQTNRREIKTANTMYILKESKVTGVIVECGFLSSHEESARLTDDAYQNKLIKAIADAIDMCK